MDTDRPEAVFILPADVKRILGILQASCSNQQMRVSVLPGSLDYFVSVGFVMFLPMVFTIVGMVCEIGCYVVESLSLIHI